MNHATLGLDAEVINHLSLSINRLGAHAAAPRHQIVTLDLRHEALQAFDEQPFRERAAMLLKAHTPEAGGQFPEAGKGQRLRQVTQRDVAALVTLAPPRQHGVGAGLDGAVDHAGEVDAEKRHLRIGDRVNEMFYEVAALRFEFIVFAAERDDVQVRVQPGRTGDPVRMQAGAVDQAAGAEGLLAGLEQVAVSLPGDLRDRRLQVDDAAARLGKSRPSCCVTRT